MESKSDIVRRLLPAIEVVLQKEAEREAERALAKAQRASALEVEDVHWLKYELPRIAGAAFQWLDTRLADAVAQARAYGLMKPLEAGADLLSPIGRVLDERSYTQALAYLLSPSETHALGQAPLHAFLQHVVSQVPGAKLAVAAVLPVLEQATAVAERELVKELDGEGGRTDIWIEVPTLNPRLLVIVEAKVGHTVTSGQLERYEVACESRAHELQLPLDAIVKVLLTVDGEHGAPGWVGMAWHDIAAVLSHLATSSSDGAVFLRLYLSAILRHFYELSSAPQSRVAKANLLRYLRRALSICPIPLAMPTHE
jgi:hypothetical protein